MAWLLLGVGLVFIVEGLVYALAPHVVEDLLEMMRQLPVETRRVVGFVAVLFGACLLWAASLFGTF